MVRGADAHQCRWETPEVRERGRDRRVATLVVGEAGQVAVGEELDADGIEKIGAGRRTDPTLARRAPPVVHAEDQVGAVDSVHCLQLVADAQQHDRGHVPAGGLTTDDDPAGPELALAVLQ